MISFFQKEQMYRWSRLDTVILELRWTFKVLGGQILDENNCYMKRIHFKMRNWHLAHSARRYHCWLLCISSKVFYFLKWSEATNVMVGWVIDCCCTRFEYFTDRTDSITCDCTDHYQLFASFQFFYMYRITSSWWCTQLITNSPRWRVLYRYFCRWNKQNV